MNRLADARFGKLIWLAALVIIVAGAFGIVWQVDGFDHPLSARDNVQIGLQLVRTVVVLLLASFLTRWDRRRRAMTADLAAKDRRHVEELSTAVAERTRELGEAMAALGESEARFRSIVDTTPLPVVLTRLADDRVAYINDAAAEAFGIARERAEGFSAPDYYADPASRQRLKQILAGQGVIRDYETVLKRANGEQFDAVLSVSTFTIGGEAMVMATVHDVTERRRLHHDLARSNADLEQFSYAVSHDLQEPLRMVSSYLALLKRRYADSLDQDAHEFIGYAVDGAQRMARMISDLLTYSRVHRRGREFSSVALGAAYAEACANLATAIDESGASLSCEPLPTVTGDATQLMRVFQNLIGNALKYRRDDGTTEIRVAARQESSEWLISVADNGIGIAPPHTERLFQVFQRLHSRERYEGTGIGLALCRRILDRHGGRIWVESAGASQGSTFHFTLPIATNPPHPMPIAAL